ncbi:uncharacterized protein LOC114274745 [Camellia sinensis]|uniref:uncharacterized protein LOC114274745 n=1 Tax=Camellia sinensis TaxID=4442 RepID=UPI00103615CA|nr:uncharacterized protein LOC114274745 [Camellia sinensis]
MDWLATNHASIDCKAKKVSLRLPNQSELVFDGAGVSNPPCIISSMTTQLLLRKGCDSYFCYVIDTQKEAPTVDAIPVVREFLDVFLEDLPGIPVVWEIEFAIETQPGTQPISKAPYRMSITELKELKTQLQELLDKGFIRLSIVREEKGWHDEIMHQLLGAEQDKLLKKKYEEQGNTPYPDFIISNGILKFRNRICVLDIPELKKKILEEAHNSRLVVYPGNTKMYHDLKEHYWWTRMKRDIASHISKCLHCQRIKAEYQRPAGLLQPLPIPKWKWEHIIMDFVVGQPQSFFKNYAIWVIVDRLTKSRQKSYVDTRRRDLEFQVGDHVFLKISPTRGVIRFGKRGKLNPRYIGPFEILERIGLVAYRLALPPELSNVHNVFHVSMLRQYLRDPKHVVDYEDLEVHEDLSYEEQPVQILDRRDQILRNKTIPLVKVLWQNHRIEEATWETEGQMRAKYPHLFES